jgi:C1A family cysteine protease
MKEINSLAINNIESYIDKGYPILWTMYSNSAVEKAYQFSAANRKNAPSADAWKRALKKVSSSSSTDGAHALLIIGYNKNTDEIAVSNSWGDKFIEPQWIPIKVAKKASQGYLVVFKP